MKALDEPKGPGVIVVVDVIRAFTTASFIIGAGCSELRAVASVEAARAMRQSDSELLLIGEQGVSPPSDFYLGNSPTAVGRTNLRDRRVVLVSSKGTRALKQAVSEPRPVLACAAVNVSATFRFMVKTQVNDVDFWQTGSSGEDSACVEAIKSLRRGIPFDSALLTRSIEAGGERRISEIGDMTVMQQREFRQDVQLCARVDAFDFALLASGESDFVRLEPRSTSLNARLDIAVEDFRCD